MSSRVTLKDISETSDAPVIATGYRGKGSSTLNLGLRYNVGCAQLPPISALHLVFLRSPVSETREINALGAIYPKWAFGSDDTDSGYFETNYSIDGQHV